MSKPLWGIDLGGTKVEGVILESLDNPKPLYRIRQETEAHLGYEHVLGRIAEVVTRLTRESGLIPSRIGFGTPGELDPVLLTMKNCNSVVLNGRPLQRDLESILGVPVVLANDANCFALAEAHWGVVADRFPEARIVFGVILGTGVGGGIVIDRQTWNGKHGIAGEWGHNYLDESGGECYCGKVGCVEKVIAGPSLERYYQGLTGTLAGLRDIAARAAAGEPAARQTLDRLHFYFGKALSVVTNLLDPDVIVIGGGVGNIPSIYVEGVESLRKHIFNNRLDVPVVPPRLGDSAGVFGAAALTA